MINIPTYVPTFAGLGVNMSTSTVAITQFNILTHPYAVIIKLFIFTGIELPGEIKTQLPD